METIKTILIVGTLDTKGEEVLYLKRIIEGKGLKTIVLDTGIIKDSPSFADITNHDVVEKAQSNLSELLAMKDESMAMGKMAKGAEKIVSELLQTEQFDGILALGGTMGTSLALRIFQRLPVGMPKGLISTVALSHFVIPQYVLTDLIMFQLIADPWGLNRLVRRDLTKAGLAMACAVQGDEEDWDASTPLIAMTTLGGSWLKYAPIIKRRLEEKDFEVAVFHSTSMQGALMERLLEAGKVNGLLDLCPQEVLAEHCKGLICSPGRMEAAAKMGIPQVVGPGGIGAFPWRSVNDIPDRFKGRVAKTHNEISSGIQASMKEMTEVAEIMAKKLNRSSGPVTVVIPEKGFFVYDSPGQPFYYPEGRKTFIETLMENLRPEIEVIRLDCHINDSEYAEKVAKIALTLFEKEIKKEETDG